MLCDFPLLQLTTKVICGVKRQNGHCSLGRMTKRKPAGASKLSVS